MTLGNGQTTVGSIITQAFADLFRSAVALQQYSAVAHVQLRIEKAATSKLVNGIFRTQVEEKA